MSEQRGSEFMDSTSDRFDDQPDRPVENVGKVDAPLGLADLLGEQEGVSSDALKPARPWFRVAAPLIVVTVGVAAVVALSIQNPRAGTQISGPSPQSGVTESTAAAPYSATSLVGGSAFTPAPSDLTITSSVSGTTVPPQTTSPQDRLKAWPSAPANPPTIDDVPTFFPTEAVGDSGTPVRGGVEGAVVASPHFTQVFVDPERSVVLTLQSAPNGVESTPAPLRNTVSIDGWDDAFFSNGVAQLVVSDPSGYVRLSSVGLDDVEAAGIVESMQRRADGIPGWDLPRTLDFVEINGAWEESAGQRFLTWFDGNRVVAQMLTSPAHTHLIAQALGSTFEQVDLRGTTAWLSADGLRQSIVWSPDGVTIVVLGVADGRIDPVNVAKSVTELGVSDYESRTTSISPAGIGDGCDGSLFC